MKPACTKAVIIAAGCGSRVRSITPEKPKCLMDLGGRPIIDWILCGLEQAGIREVVIVTGFRAACIQRALGRRQRKLRISYVHNPRWRLPNGLSVYAARRAIGNDERFLLVMSDHLLAPAAVARVARAGTSKCVLAVDTNISRVFDLGDATKVRVVAGKPVAINKRLRKYNAVDCGLFRFDSRVFAALAAAFKEGAMSLTGGVKQLVASGDLEVVPIGKKTFWMDIDTPRAYKEALRRLDTLRLAHRAGRRQKHARTSK
jgi:choline kinase